jgi:hypothetical protein
MKRLMSYFKPVFFRLKWLFMPPKAKYAYLWAKTRELIDRDYSFREITVHNN